MRLIPVSMVLAAACGLYAPLAGAMIEPDDQKLIDAASCDDLAKEHRSFTQSAKDVEEEIRKSGNRTVAANVVGAATLAVVGFGFFHWDDHADLKENLAELREYREAIAAAAAKKSCPVKP